MLNKEFELMITAMATVKKIENEFPREFNKLADLIGEADARSVFTKLFTAYTYADELDDAGRIQEAEEVEKMADQFFAPYQEMIEEAEEAASAEEFALMNSEEMIEDYEALLAAWDKIMGSEESEKE